MGITQHEGFSCNLNEKQLAAVTNMNPLLVIAGAGTGKTNVITNKIAYLISRKNYQPDRILAVTFTNKAANEMKDRLNAMLPNASPRHVTTFHSLCLAILRRHTNLMGEPYDSRFTVSDEKDSQSILNDIIKNMCKGTAKKEKLTEATPSLFPELRQQSTIQPAIPPGTIIDEDYAAYLISKVKQQYCSDVAEAVTKLTKPNSPYSEIAKRYQQQIRDNNTLDFDDIIQTAYRILLKHPTIKQKWATMFDFILLDEYQDVNSIQAELVHILYNGNPKMGICAVADPQQTIYTWRGANPASVFEFTKTYHADEIRLEQNYRSGKKILLVANAISNTLTGQWKDKVLQLWTDSDLNGYIDYTTYMTDDHEKNTIAQNIRSIVAAGYKYKDIAVLSRIGSILNGISMALMQHGIPHESVGATSFAKRSEIKDLTAYLRLFINPMDKASFTRVINIPKRGIGPQTTDSIALHYDTDWIKTIANMPFKRSQQPHINQFLSLYRSLAPHAENRPYDTLMNLIEATGYLRHLQESNPETATERTENVSQLANMLKNDQDAGIGLSDFLERNTMAADQDHLTDANTVKLMTVHSTKGLEFPVVILPILEEDVFPCSKALESQESADEERRCFYVAVTRAKEMLYFSNAITRSSFGKEISRRPSRYIRDIENIL